jgi:metallo-beta-lactamase class B
MSHPWMLGWIASLALAAQANAAAIDCSYCADWNKGQAPFQVYGNTYYVGPHGLSAVLITSPQGHVLIDGALPQSAPLIAKHVEQLGFRMTDVKVILNSHTHYDHAGGIAELQQLSGAKVIASDKAAPVLRIGKVGPDDPQVGHLLPFPAVSNVEALGRRQKVEVGTLQLSVIHTPGHSPGGTSWQWQSCEAGRCLNMMYSDSLNAVADSKFKYGGDARYPTAAKDLISSMAAIAAAPCDVLITAHPELSGLWTIVDEQGKGDRTRLDDPAACRRYVATARQRLEQRLASEKADKK